MPRLKPPPDGEARFRAYLDKKDATIRDLDLDAFADGIIAHREGRQFHENPDGIRPTLRRLSWSLGWNERALWEETQHG